jgi:rhodanese-related sulfurtransferase
MIPGWVINVGTLAAVATGFVIGWIWRGGHDRDEAAEMLKKAGIEVEKPDDG